MFPGHEDLTWSPDCASDTAPLILLAEEGAGLTTYLNWLEVRGRSGSPPTDGRADAVEINFQDLEGFDSSRLETGIADRVAQSLGSLPDRGLIPTLQTARERAAVVVLTHIERLDRGVGARVLAQLRAGFETANPARTLQGLALVLIGRDEHAFEMEPYSAIHNISHTCRLPRFTPAEIARDLVGADRVPTAAGLLHKMTGGQPFLTRRVAEALASGGDLALAYRSVRDRPPEDLLANWRRRLARIVLRSRELQEFANDLARGREYVLSEAPFPTKALAIAGWMSRRYDEQDRPTHWRFSDLHRAWAEPVLRNPRGWVEGVGR